LAATLNEQHKPESKAQQKRSGGNSIMIWYTIYPIDPEPQTKKPDLLSIEAYTPKYLIPYNVDQSQKLKIIFFNQVVTFFYFSLGGDHSLTTDDTIYHINRRQNLVSRNP
jgi:hypothetical protein